MELGVPVKDLLDPLAPEGFVRPVDDPFERRDLSIGDPFANDLKGVALQDRPELEKILDILGGIVGNTETAGFGVRSEPSCSSL